MQPPTQTSVAYSDRIIASKIPPQIYYAWPDTPASTHLLLAVKKPARLNLFGIADEAIPLTL